MTNTNRLHSQAIFEALLAARGRMQSVQAIAVHPDFLLLLEQEQKDLRAPGHELPSDYQITKWADLDLFTSPQIQPGAVAVLTRPGHKFHDYGEMK